MKTLMLIRHAKSSWGNALISDFDRPLNDRGHRDAPMMGQRLYDKKIPVNAFISSTANRAFTTATYFAHAYHTPKEQIIPVPELYHVGHPVFHKVISSLENNIQHAAVFSHNPGITSFINELTETQIDHMPTCGVFAIKIMTDDWSDFKDASKTFWFFDYPKSGNN